MGFVRITDKRHPADRTNLWKNIRHLRAVAFFRHARNNFRDDIAGLVNDDVIADPDILILNHILIVQLCETNACPCQAHRRQLGVRRDLASPANGDEDVFQPRHRFFRREFIRDRPLRGFRRKA